jgi:hypothetical protein
VLTYYQRTYTDTPSALLVYRMLTVGVERRDIWDFWVTAVSLTSFYELKLLDSRRFGELCQELNDDYVLFEESVEDVEEYDGNFDENRYEEKYTRNE